MSTSFGLDIGSTQAKAVEAEKTNQGFVLKHLGVAGFNPGGEAAAIRELLKSGGINPGHEANLALAENEIYSRIVSVPRLSETELNSAIQYEAEQYVPVALDEVELFHQILGENTAGEAKTMKVLLIAVPKARLKHLNQLLDTCGLIPRSLETELMALKRVLAEPGRYQLLLLLAHKTTDMIIIYRDEPILMHSLPAGSLSLTRNLVNEMGLSETQAEQYKQTYGLRADLLEGKVAQVLLPQFQELVNQINKAYVFLTQQGFRKTPEQVVLTGGGALLPGLTNFLVDKLNSEVVVANPFARFVRDKTFKRLVVSDANPQWTTAVGLALKGL